MPRQSTDAFKSVAADARATAEFIATAGRQAHTTSRLHVLYNHAARPRPDYVFEPSDHCFVQMPKGELAATVYQAARNGGAGRVESAKLWWKTRFPK